MQFLNPVTEPHHLLYHIIYFLVSISTFSRHQFSSTSTVFSSPESMTMTLHCMWSETARVATSALWKNGTGGLSAEGASTETPKVSRGWGNVEGIPPPHPTRGPGECCKLPQWGAGRSPGKFWFLGHFLCQKHDVYAAVLRNLSRFLN